MWEGGERGRGELTSSSHILYNMELHITNCIPHVHSHVFTYDVKEINSVDYIISGSDELPPQIL